MQSQAAEWRAPILLGVAADASNRRTCEPCVYGPASTLASAPRLPSQSFPAYVLSVAWAFSTKTSTSPYLPPAFDDSASDACTSKPPNAPVINVLLRLASSLLSWASFLLYSKYS